MNKHTPMFITESRVSVIVYQGERNESFVNNWYQGTQRIQKGL